MHSVPFEPKKLQDYASLVGEEVVEQVCRLACPLRGARVLHVNSTAYGGGVAEILRVLAPLMQDAGLEVEWQVIEADEAFFQVSKAMHNGLQGMNLPFDVNMQVLWERANRENAARLRGTYDFVVVHDPQPAGLAHFRARAGARHWLWRCHIDTSNPQPAFWEFLVPYLQAYDAGIFTLEAYVGPGIRFEHLAIIPPTIDPLSPKNVPLAPERARQVVARFGFDPRRPLLVQVSRFDPWKDPLGVIDAYRQVKARRPEVQLALVGALADDDPEGWDYLDRTLRHAGEDFDVRILHNFHGVGDVEVNAFQIAADVVIQKSIREGFGLVVTEALWKAKPVVGSKVGGIPLQVCEGETGFLVENVEACAEKALYLLENPEVARQMGQKGHEHVRRHFLITRQLADYLKLFAALDRLGPG